jgi:hypothetical protein
MGVHVTIYERAMQQWDDSSEITQIRVTMLTNFGALIHCIEGFYVVDQERENTLCFSASCLIRDNSDVDVCYSWELALNSGLDVSFDWHVGLERNMAKRTGNH